MVDSYASAEKDSRGLRGLIKSAISGVKNVLGTDEEAAEQRRQVQNWGKELELSDTFVRDYLPEGDKAVDAYLDERSGGILGNKYKLNLFHSNIDTLMSIMYAKLPKVEADRRFNDPNDDVARVAAAIITRLLQNDMNDPEDRLNAVLRQALQDRLVPGLGAGRIRYCMTEGPDPTAVKPEDAGEDYAPPQIKTDEWCDIEYIHWRDFRWSPCRTPAEVRWKAFRTYMTKDEVRARFGDVADRVPYNTKGPSLDGEEKSTEISAHTDRAQAEIWEIWDRPSRCVYWYVKGFDEFLDKKDDPMELDGFFPDARPMFANITTRRYLPKPDYSMSRGLYQEIDELEQRIALLTKAVKVAGVYPANAKEIQRLLTEDAENRLIPVDAWAIFAEKGGLKGQVEYLPIKDIVEALQVLVLQQANRIEQLYQVTGMSDIIRGQAAKAGVTATEQRIKAQFASTRMQSFQDQFAEFAADLLNLKVQLIRKFYDPERIIRLSNIDNTPDAELAEQAIQLIKDPSLFDMRVAVRSESMAQINYDSIKMERTEFMASLAQFITAAAPLFQAMPASAPFLLELLKFNLAGLKGANEMEGVIDRAIGALQQQQAEQASKPPEPSPEEKAAQIKVQGDIQVAQAKGAADAQTKQVEVAAELQKAGQEHQLEMEKLRAEIQADREQHQLEMEKMRLEIQFMAQKYGLQLQMEQQKAAIDAEKQDQELETDERRFELEQEQEQERFESEEEYASERHQREMQQQQSKRGSGDEG
jgi:hypothetical protein